MVFRLFLFLINATQAVNTVKLLGIFFFFFPPLQMGFASEYLQQEQGVCWVN